MLESLSSPRVMLPSSPILSVPPSPRSIATRPFLYKSDSDILGTSPSDVFASDHPSRKRDSSGGPSSESFIPIGSSTSLPLEPFPRMGSLTCTTSCSSEKDDCDDLEGASPKSAGRVPKAAARLSANAQGAALHPCTSTEGGGACVRTLRPPLENRKLQRRLVGSGPHSDGCIRLQGRTDSDGSGSFSSRSHGVELACSDGSKSSSSSFSSTSSDSFVLPNCLDSLAGAPADKTDSTASFCRPIDDVAGDGREPHAFGPLRLSSSRSMDHRRDARPAHGDVSTMSAGDEECPFKTARRTVHSPSKSMDMKEFDFATSESRCQLARPEENENARVPLSSNSTDTKGFINSTDTKGSSNSTDIKGFDNAQESQPKHRSLHGGSSAFSRGSPSEASRSMSRFPSLSRLRLSSRDSEAGSPSIPSASRAHSSGVIPLPCRLPPGLTSATPSSGSPQRERCHSLRGGPGSGSASGSGSGLLSLKRKRPPMLEIPLKDSFTASPQGTPSPLRDARGVQGGREGGASQALLEDMKECAEEGRGYAVLCKRGRRREVMEDRFRAVTELGGDTQLAFFGVYDGHGGTAAADFVSKELHLSLVESLKKRTAADAEAAVVDAYVDTDRMFLEHGSSSGACCVSCLALPNELIIAHAGDCRAVMCSNGKARVLTQDHKASREDERQRIEALGGLVDDFTGTWRVQGVIAVTRGIGDLNLKEYISAVPETCSAVARSTEDFLILASDGLWDVVSNEEAVSVAHSILFPEHIKADSMGKDTRTIRSEPTENSILGSDILATKLQSLLSPSSQRQTPPCSTPRGDGPSQHSGCRAASVPSLGVPQADRSGSANSHEVALLSPSARERGSLSEAPCSLVSSPSGKGCSVRQVEAGGLNLNTEVKTGLFSGFADSDRCGGVSQPDNLLSRACRRLTDLAVKRGSCDDITVMIILPASLKP